MARAQIKINGSDSRFTAVAIGGAVALSNDDNGGETSYAWTLVDQPEGTADTLSATNVRDVTLTPTKEGSYELQLVVNGTLTQTAVVAVLDTRTGERIPAATETTESGTAEGWALAVKRILARVLHASVDGNVVVARTPGGIAAGAIVSLTSQVTVNTGTQAAFDVTSIAAALGTATHADRLGVLVDGVVPGSLGAGALVLVRMFGLVAGSGAGSPSVGDPVYLSDTGTAALTPGTIRRAIGTVVASSGGLYRWVIESGVLDPGNQFSGRMLTAPIQLTGSGSGTFPAGTCVVMLDGIGGGGGGGGGKGNASVSAAGGGTSGVRLRKTIGTPGVPLSTLAYSWVAGTGGPAGLGATPTDGSSGNDTTVTIAGTVYTMRGGGGGIAMTGSANGNVGSHAPAAGTSGVTGESAYGRAGQGFAIAGSAWTSGAGGGTDLGTGGDSVGGTTVGNPGQGMGGGGSGGAASGASTSNGGAGANGGAWVTPYS
jgi:hypothetical protein